MTGRSFIDIKNSNEPIQLNIEITIWKALQTIYKPKRLGMWIRSSYDNFNPSPLFNFLPFSIFFPLQYYYYHKEWIYGMFWMNKKITSSAPQKSWSNSSFLASITCTFIVWSEWLSVYRRNIIISLMLHYNDCGACLSDDMFFKVFSFFRNNQKHIKSTFYLKT